MKLTLFKAYLLGPQVQNKQIKNVTEIMLDIYNRNLLRHARTDSFVHQFIVPTSSHYKKQKANKFSDPGHKWSRLKCFHYLAAYMHLQLLYTLFTPQQTCVRTAKTNFEYQIIYSYFNFSKTSLLGTVGNQKKRQREITTTLYVFMEPASLKYTPNIVNHLT